MNEKYSFKKWSKGTIESILTNEIYKGYIVWGRRGGRRNPGKRDDYTVSNKNYTPLIDNKLWNMTSNLRKVKSSSKNFKYFTTPFLLQDKLYCCCHEEITPQIVCKNYGSNKKSAYRCPIKEDGKNKSHLIIDKNTLEDRFIQELSNTILTKQIDSLWKLYYEEKSHKEKMLNEATNNYKSLINELEKKLSKLKDALNLPMNTDVKLELQQLLVRKNKEIKHYRDTITSKKQELGYLYDTKDKFKRTFNNLFLSFNDLDVYNKRMIIHSIVDTVKITKYDKTKNIIDMEIVLNPSSQLFKTS